MKMSVVRKNSIVGEHLTLSDCCGQSSLWAKYRWIEFTLVKLCPQGKVPGFASVFWGYHFGTQNRNIVD